MLTVLANIWAQGMWGGGYDFDRAKAKYDNYQGLKAHVPIANNTWIHKDDAGNHHIRHHNTDIMSFSPEGHVTINPDGWHSVTTISRINDFLPGGAQVRSDHQRRTRANPDGPRKFLHLGGTAHPFHDGISFDSHTNEILPDDHVRPSGTPVMPPRARGQATPAHTQAPLPRDSGAWRNPPTRDSVSDSRRPGYQGPRPGVRGCQYPNGPCTCPGSLGEIVRAQQARIRLRRSGPEQPAFPAPRERRAEPTQPGQYYDREADQETARDADRNVPWDTSSYDQATSTPGQGAYGEDMPREGENFDTWLGRTGPTPPPTQCRTCRGKGYVRTGRDMIKADCDKCGGAGTRDPEAHTSSLKSEDEMETLSNRYTAGLRALAFGETVAPVDVDTLRDEECPVCGESSSSFDGKTCQVCGFDAPPVMFRDPDLEKARSLDLRKDVIDGGNTLPGQDGLTPGQQDANGGLPGEIPGNGVPGSDQVPMDPSMLGPDGQPMPGADGQMPQQQVDPAAIVQQQMEQLQSGVPLTPDMLGPDGSVGQGGDPMAQGGQPGMMDSNGDPIDPGGLDAAGNPMDPAMSPGLPPTQLADPNAPALLGGDTSMAPNNMGPEGQFGENGPEGPRGPDESVDPGALDAQGNPVAPDGQEFTEKPAEGDPGTPMDGTADLVCPACGFSADAQQPTSTDMDTQAVGPAGAGDGTMAGDVCPNCGAATMVSTGEMEQMDQQMQQAPPAASPAAAASGAQGLPVQALRKLQTKPKYRVMLGVGIRQIRRHMVSTSVGAPYVAMCGAECHDEGDINAVTVDRGKGKESHPRHKDCTKCADEMLSEGRMMSPLGQDE